jgi:hypothetical protein
MASLGAKNKRPKAIVTLEREAEAIELRKAGLTYAQIGEALGISEVGAHKAVGRALEKFKSEMAEQTADVRQLELQRLDALFYGVWLKAQSGDPASIGSAMKIMERRAKLLGLDAATKSELSGPDGGPLAMGVFAVPFEQVTRDAWAAKAVEQAENEDAEACRLLGLDDGSKA